MDEGPGKDRRAYFRLRYPQGERPSIRIEGRDYQLAEISEGGGRIILSGTTAIQRGQEVAGAIRFHDGQRVEVEGVVLRISETEFVVQLSRGVTPTRMMAEQIWLRKKYPMLPSESD
jgi:hypothetical protein